MACIRPDVHCKEEVRWICSGRELVVSEPRGRRAKFACYVAKWARTKAASHPATGELAIRTFTRLGELAAEGGLFVALVYFALALGTS
jgi:hypothetical protein